MNPKEISAVCVQIGKSCSLAQTNLAAGVEAKMLDTSIPTARVSVVGAFRDDVFSEMSLGVTDRASPRSKVLLHVAGSRRSCGSSSWALRKVERAGQRQHADSWAGFRVNAAADALVTALERRGRLSGEERQALAGAVARLGRVPQGGYLLHEGSCPAEALLLLDGFAACSKVLTEGERQITAMHVPGDFVGLHAFLLKSADHGVSALTDCLVAILSNEALQAITEAYPNLSRLLWLNTLVDAATCREWLAAMGRRPALRRLARLLCELFLRLEAVGLAQRKGGESEGTPGSKCRFRLPLTQTELADALGLSSVHVNRMVRELRGLGLATWGSGGVVTIRNWHRLVQLAEFDPGYLKLGQGPR